MVSFEEFFKTCRGKLKNPLEEWPTRWSDLPKPYTDKQTELLKAYQTKNPGQPILDRNKRLLRQRLAAILHRRLSLLLRVAGLHGRDMATASRQHVARHGSGAGDPLVSRAQAWFDRDQRGERHDGRVHHRRQVR